MDAGTGECKHDLRSFRKEHGDSTRVLLERPCQCSKRLCFQQFRGRESDVLAERFGFHKKEAYKKERLISQWYNLSEAPKSSSTVSAITDSDILYASDEEGEVFAETPSNASENGGEMLLATPSDPHSDVQSDGSDVQPPNKKRKYMKRKSGQHVFLDLEVSWLKKLLV